ncbi:hypothetical protein scyTo_0004881 [Scyliorhinus torazame]|uniref:Uncharacterized protein n=1 Tax=Scyliorhinus torazame TaxID=75743 RepID=A0A401NYH5_SCYTO|nr:hypothetical protein [Scyliorhinus torazame]
MGSIRQSVCIPFRALASLYQIGLETREYRVGVAFPDQHLPSEVVEYPGANWRNLFEVFFNPQSPLLHTVLSKMEVGETAVTDLHCPRDCFSRRSSYTVIPSWLGLGMSQDVCTYSWFQ